MPRSKRSPIDYTPQFGGGIFRPREVVESELAAADDQAAPAVERPAETASPDPVIAPRTRQRSGSVRTNEPTNVRTNERPKIRHTFDIFQDQLLALAEIQAARFKETGRKPRMGDLAQEALDAYIAHVTQRSNERTNRRSNAG